MECFNVPLSSYFLAPYLLALAKASIEARSAFVNYVLLSTVI